MGVVTLKRTPLVPGEVPYGIKSILGWSDKTKRVERGFVRPHVLKDGSLVWDIPDFPENIDILRKYYSGKGPAGSKYSWPGAAGTIIDPSQGGKKKVLSEIDRVAGPSAEAKPKPEGVIQKPYNKKAQGA